MMVLLNVAKTCAMPWLEVSRFLTLGFRTGAAAGGVVVAITASLRWAE